MLGDDRARVAVAEFGFEPAPCAGPVVAAFLFLGPDDAAGQPGGLAQLHGALVAVADAAGRIGLQRRSGGLSGLSRPDPVPVAVKIDGALLVGSTLGFGIAVGIAAGTAATHRDKAEAVRPHGFGRPPSPTAIQKEKVPDPVPAHGVILGGH